MFMFKRARHLDFGAYRINRRLPNKTSEIFGRLRYCADVRAILFTQNKVIEMRKFAYLLSHIKWIFNTE